MRAHLLSMSKMQVAYACSYGFKATTPQSPRPSGFEARVGSCFHKLAECHVKGKKVEAEAEPDVIAGALGFYNNPQTKAFLDSRKWTMCETGLSYDASTDKCVVGPKRGEPGYDDHGPMVLKGTLDLVYAYADWAEVYDLKTGQHQDNKDQLYAQAVAVSRYFDVKRVKVAYAYIRKTKFDAPLVEELDEDRLDYEAGRIQRLLRKLPMAKPVRGDWCFRCDARTDCPKWAANAA